MAEVVKKVTESVCCIDHIGWKHLVFYRENRICQILLEFKGILLTLVQQKKPPTKRGAFRILILIRLG
jgi:hypothetical protein